jgi:hypothetical protein
MSSAKGIVLYERMALRITAPLYMMDHLLELNSIKSDQMSGYNRHMAYNI